MAVATPPDLDPFRFERKARESRIQESEGRVYLAAVDWFDAQEAETVRRLRAASTRKGTRHWAYEVWDPSAEKKALDPEKVFPPDKMAATFDDSPLPGEIVKVWEAYGRETGDALGIAFDLHDPEVTKAILARQNLVRGASDETYSKIRSQIIAGEANGETIAQIEKRVRGVFAQARGYRARMIARTETISSANGGSIAAARQSGVVGRKRWLSASDGRTRQAHALADGQEVGLDDDFIVMGEAIDHPGLGSAANAINCRCTMTFVRNAEGVGDEETPIEPDSSGDGLPFLPPDQARGMTKELGQHFLDEFARLEQGYEGGVQNLSKDQIQAILDYTGAGSGDRDFVALQEALRGERPMTPDLKKYRDDLNDALRVLDEGRTTDRPEVVYRRVRPDEIRGLGLDDLDVGDSFQVDQFWSTSIEPGRFSIGTDPSDLVVEIIPRSGSGAYVSPASRYGSSGSQAGEWEYLFGSGRRFQVVEVLDDVPYGPAGQFRTRVLQLVEIADDPVAAAQELDDPIRRLAAKAADLRAKAGAADPQEYVDLGEEIAKIARSRVDESSAALQAEFEKAKEAWSKAFGKMNDGSWDFVQKYGGYGDDGLLERWRAANYRLANSTEGEVWDDLIEVVKKQKGSAARKYRLTATQKELVEEVDLDDVKALGKLRNAEDKARKTMRAAEEAAQRANAEAVQEVLEELRDFGRTSKIDFLPGSSGTGMVESQARFFPRDWWDSSDDMPYRIWSRASTKRAHYRDYRRLREAADAIPERTQKAVKAGELQIPKQEGKSLSYTLKDGTSGDTYVRSTTAHELSHRMEDAVPAIKRAEFRFWREATNDGENFGTLSTGFREYGDEDGFWRDYCGRWYGKEPEVLRGWAEKRSVSGSLQESYRDAMKGAFDAVEELDDLDLPFFELLSMGTEELRYGRYGVLDEFMAPGGSYADSSKIRYLRWVVGVLAGI